MDARIRGLARDEQSGMKTPYKLGLAGLLICAPLVLTSSCRSSTPNRSPLGELLPPVSARTLEREELQLPGELSGAPAVLLIGYVQNAQFDLDRWILGLIQAETPVRFLELPTIDGMVPGMIAGTIDSGMRSGIPAEDWGAVATLYGEDAARIVRWTGDERGLNGRIVLLDAGGSCVWFHDRGYSATKLLELDARVRELQAAGW